MTCIGAGGPADELGLVQRVRSGDDAALAELFGRYAGFIRSCSSSMYSPGLDRDDLAQEGLIGLYAAVRTFSEGGASFPSYARVLIKRHMLTAVRNALRQKNLPLSNYVPLDDAEGDIAGGGDDPEQALISAEEEKALRQALAAKLTADERRVLAMYLNGASYAKTAAAMGANVKYIDNSLQRIKKKLSGS